MNESTTLSRFELRLFDNVEEDLDASFGQKSLLTGIWIDGELLDETPMVSTTYLPANVASPTALASLKVFT